MRQHPRGEPISTRVAPVTVLYSVQILTTNFHHGQTMSQTTTTSYDELLYTDNSFAETHPSHLAAVATLFGMETPSLKGSRVLELGCGMGGNLIPMAISLPEAEYLGIDLSSKQIAQGNKVVTDLGLANIELRHESILDFGRDNGTFDFILCHGVYSWVPDAVREKILEILAQQLSPNGVAYVSYNTYPGWHMRGMVRDIMRYHAQQFPAATEKVEQARAFLGFLSQAVSKSKSAYIQMLQDEVELLSDVPDTYLYHEHLEENNDPVYFHEFAARASEHGLQYLGESTMHHNWASGFSTEVVEVLQRISKDVVHAQQYLDFLRNTGFRRSLLCHANVELERDLDTSRFERLLVATAACPVDEVKDLESREVVHFESRGGKLASDEPIIKAAILTLAEAWPASIPFAELPARARSRIKSESADPEHDRQQLVHMLTSATKSAEIFEWRMSDPSFVTQPSPRPLACPLARYKLLAGNRLTNRLHRTIEISDPVTRHLLIHCDGAHTEEMFVEMLLELAKVGKLIMRDQQGQPIEEEETLRLMLAHSVRKILHGLASAAVLIA